MGFDYSFELTWCQTEGLAALEALAVNLEVSRHETAVFWRSKHLVLPCSVNFKNASVTIAPGQRVTLDTSIWLPEDPAYAAFLGSDAKRQPRSGMCGGCGKSDGAPQPMVAVGYIYLSIVCGQRRCRFSFTAPTTDISVYFQRSQAVRHWFVEFGRQTSAIEVLFDDESGDCEDLTSGKRVAPLPLDWPGQS
jgi:hypothetical protein